MALPDTAQTRGMLDRRRIALLPRQALVINVGRGTAIEQEALADALNEGIPPSALFEPQASWREWQQTSDAAEQAAQRVTVLALPPLGVRSLV